ncbi:sugar phosphate isomerase/epimerase [Planomicrobium sp. CPCC 101110]|uniref:sugar phosphate isomerase/epimerase family protein n=1 Tax=Planomicrobium sp. CPCC 101110 TaxID=2599619 RepID=UPI0011B55EA2|nr:sugar phosphate isomerase/epimerase family protein [Planomicrobium sp. CPCC 101110]TWT27272.1 sugar phosphate isomerase/epimerase [Planomicrobium sp. CPCC 101110]
MKLGTQNQPFFPEKIGEKFRVIKEMGFDGFEIDGKLLVDNLDEVKRAVEETGLPVASACGGYDGWIGDFNEEKRLNGLNEIKEILKALQQVGGKGIVVPAAWGQFSYRLPPLEPPRDEEGDRDAINRSLAFLNEAAEETGTVIYLEPLNRYEDHMINTVADARRYVESNGFERIQVIADFYHMNIEEDDMAETLHANRDVIGHIHLADNQRFQPGSGSLDFKRLFEGLKKDGYSGYLTLECRVKGENLEEQYRESAEFLRKALA